MKKQLVLCCILYMSLGHASFCGAKGSPSSSIRMNATQVVGSHNSYKKEIQPELLERIKAENSELAAGLDYRHVSLPEQLTLGLRNLELDVVYDPQGGRFTRPFGNELLAGQGVTPLPYDTLGEMKRPGFKVMHVPDLDFRSWCPLFVEGLKQIKEWSDAHPHHVPIVITINAKSDNVPKQGFTPLLPFTAAAFDSLDEEIRSVFSRERLVTPDDVRGTHATLNEAIRAGNWPLLDDTRGKVLIVLDEGGEKQKTYLLGHPSLRGRVMFVNAAPGDEASAFVIMNDPVTYKDSISVLVKQGYIVRTRADADTREARVNDRRRMNAAITSGAQIVTTDYYLPDARLETGYQVRLPGNVMFRYDPVLMPESIGLTTVE